MLRCENCFCELHNEDEVCQSCGHKKGQPAAELYHIFPISQPFQKREKSKFQKLDIYKNLCYDIYATHFNILKLGHTIGKSVCS